MSTSKLSVFWDRCATVIAFFGTIGFYACIAAKLVAYGLLFAFAVWLWTTLF